MLALFVCHLLYSQFRFQQNDPCVIGFLWLIVAKTDLASATMEQSNPLKRVNVIRILGCVGGKYMQNQRGHTNECLWPALRGTLTDVSLKEDHG